MLKIKEGLKSDKIAAILIVALLVMIPISQVFSMNAPQIEGKKTVKMSRTLEDIKSGSLDSRYNTKLNAPFNQATGGIREEIRLDTGDLIIGKELINVSGKNDLNLELNLRYQASQASFYDETTRAEEISVVSKGKILIAYYDSFETDGSFRNTRGVPYQTQPGEKVTVEKEVNIKGTNEKLFFNGYYCYEGSEKNIYHAGNIKNSVREKSKGDYDSTFGLGLNIDMPSLNIDNGLIYVTLDNGQTYRADFNKQSGLTGYELTNIQFAKYSAEETATENSAYKLSYANGYKIYYNASGEVIEEEGLYGNQIIYYYDQVLGKKELVKIADKSGRCINLSYTADTVTIDYGEKKISLIKKEIAKDKWVLDKIIDEMGNETSYDYEIKEAAFDGIGTGKMAANKIALVTNIKYQNGLETKYEYSEGTKNFSKGQAKYYKVSKRYDVSKGTIKNELKYEYFGEPDGYPNGHENVNESYQYKTRQTDKKGEAIDFTYNGRHQLIKEEQSVLVEKEYQLKKSIATSYVDKLNLPQKVVSTEYGAEGLKKEHYDYYGYDSRGNLVSTASPKENTEESKKAYETRNVYDYSFNIKIREGYKKDQNTGILVENKLDDNRKNIIETNVFRFVKENVQASELVKVDTKNLVPIRKTTYRYDGNNNLIEAKLFSDNKPVRTDLYEYDKKGLYPVRQIIEDVKLGKTDKRDLVTEYEYDFFTGLLLRQKNAEDNQTYYDYDKADRVVNVVNPDGTEINYKYDDKTNIIEAVNENGELSKYTYTPTGSLEAIEYPSEQLVAKRNQYDAYERLTSEENAEGARVEYAYDSFSRLEAVALLDAGNKLLMKKELKYEDVYKDKSGRLYTRVSLSQIGNDNKVTKNFYYNRYEELEKEGILSGEQELTKSYDYDYQGNVVSYEDELKQSSTYEYDIFGNLLKDVNPKKYATNYYYDSLGNLTRLKDANDINYYYEYNNVGLLISQSMPYKDGVYVKSYADYDSLGNLVRTVNAKNEKLDYSYDKRGQLTGVKQYDKNQRSITTKYTYDNVGRLTSLKKGITNETDDTSYQENKYFYNGLGDLVKELDEQGKETSYKYDKEGRLIEKTDRNGITTFFKYDGAGRLIEKRNSKESEENLLNYEYDLMGNLVRTKDELAVTDYSYDDLNRVTNVQVKNSEYSLYDKAQSPFINDKGTSTVIQKKYSYDNLSRIKSFEIYNNTTLEQKEEYRYDELSRLTGIKEKGILYAYEYDKTGKLLKESNPVTNVDRNYTYYKSGKVRSVVTDKVGKDSINLAAIDRAYYEYDELGNITYKEENQDKYTYNYDMLGRLEYSIFNDSHIDYEYDKYGNIQQEIKYKEDQSKPNKMFAYSKTDYKYDSGNRLTYLNYTEGSRTFDIQKETFLQYDGEGNLLEKKDYSRNENMGNLGTEINRYTYNGFNQQTGYSGGKGDYRYYYNAEGLRSRKEKLQSLSNPTFQNEIEQTPLKTEDNKPANVINYYYNNGNIVLETDKDNQTTAKTLHGIHLIKRETKGALPAAIATAKEAANPNLVPTSSLASNANLTEGEEDQAAYKDFITYYYLQNSNGDVTKLLDCDGKVIKDYQYEPFGKDIEGRKNTFGDNYFQSKWKEEVEDQALNNPYKYTGQYQDQENGNYYLRARYYDPSIQRFTQEDSYPGSVMEPGSLNWYAYCGNDPINNIDPSGYKTVKVQSNGKAPTGLKKGDIVKTAGGNYKITGVNKNGSYKSEKVKSGNSSSSSSNKSTSSGGSSKGSSVSVTVTLKNGTTVKATLKNGVTTLTNGSRPPEGAVVHTASGDYRMSGGSGKKVSPYANLNTLGTVTSSMGTGITALGDTGKVAMPNAIANTPKPNNIGAGTWNKTLAANTATAASDMNKVSNFGTKVGNTAIVIDVGCSIYQDYNAGKPISKIAYDAAVNGAVGIGGVGATKLSTVAGEGLGGPPGAIIGGVAGPVAYTYYVDVQTYENLGNKTARQWAIDLYDPKR
ncbi:RHS repeat-associated core domain-containing protein [Aminipila butyrica]|uniref:RHS repeat-associated core domain-containing protein n=1 Tax=Aminipila butyrica TaxID=433296 RepID=A0A858BWS3_9FIRM|nr:RHS repeat-associated core domain-containing protein [Aminipila butyrica]QIB70017.1 RHS repeat-associated core domain-containing protein [Aminipila butyrica]